MEKSIYIFSTLLTTTICTSAVGTGNYSPYNSTYSIPDTHTWSDAWTLNGSFEATYWASSRPAPGLLKFPGNSTFSPRLTLSLDYSPNPQWYFHATLRVDDGFDPNDEPDGQIRLDEIALRYRPFGDTRLNIQIGKSATVFGAWVQQHGFHDDPFLLAPLAYGQTIGIGVQNPASLSPANITARANGTAPGVFETPKRVWGSTIWGPNYTSGLSIFGNYRHFDYAFEIKNAGLGSHPPEWNPHREDFSSPTITGRVGYRPNAAWKFGISASQGPYLETRAESLLPPGVNRGDLSHTLVGLDARWAHGNWMVSAEVIASEIETLATENLRSLSWYLQTRWKASPGFWIALRTGQTINNRITGTNGSSVEWSPNLWRSELGIGWRITPETLLKSQYAYTHTHGSSTGPGEHLFALGISRKF